MVFEEIVMTDNSHQYLHHHHIITNASAETFQDDLYMVNGHRAQVKRVKGNDKIQVSKGKKKGDFNA